MKQSNCNQYAELKADIGMAHEEGITLGIMSGRTEGLIDGLAVGEARGELRRTLEIAKAMISHQLSTDIIMACTGLSKEAILAL